MSVAIVLKDMSCSTQNTLRVRERFCGAREDLMHAAKARMLRNAKLLDGEKEIVEE